MWALIFFLYLNGSIGITHIDSFASEKLCEKAADKAMTEAKKLNKNAIFKNIDVQYACLLEIS